MSQRAEMPPARRRPMPGMASSTGPSPPPALAPVPDRPQRAQRQSHANSPAISKESHSSKQRRPAVDYGATRLVNFRLPVDLHDRIKALVRETEAAHPRLRHPSLTELIIAMLEEAPSTTDEVAALIRRKRSAEHAAD